MCLSKGSSRHFPHSSIKTLIFQFPNQCLPESKIHSKFRTRLGIFPDFDRFSTEMDFPQRLVCPENGELAAFMKNKWQEMAQNPKGISDNLNKTIHKAYSNVCNSKVPIKSLKDLAEIKGVGKWILRLMKGFFHPDSADSENEDVPERGKRNKGTRRYMPQKNSVAYALLITLYRETENQSEFLHKQDLITAAEASGLSRAPIAPELGKGKPGPFGNSPQSWYSGWSCMKTLITKGLVVKSSCPAKYMLTEEGKESARECLSRSHLIDNSDNSANARIIAGLKPRVSDTSKGGTSNLASAQSNFSKEASLPSFHFNIQKSINIPSESLNKFIQMGFSREQTVRAFLEASETSRTEDISSLWPTVLCRLKEDQVYGLREDHLTEVTTCNFVSNSSDNKLINTARVGLHMGSKSSVLADSVMISSNSGDNRMINVTQSEGGKFSDVADSDHRVGPLRACSFTGKEPPESKANSLAMPPLDFGETFEDTYAVILIIDDREHFANPRSNLRKIIDNISSQFKIPIEVRRLPVGDAIWVARNKSNGTEYVLDFVVERKRVDDLRDSIRDNRYKDQKLRLLFSQWMALMNDGGENHQSQHDIPSLRNPLLDVKILTPPEDTLRCGLKKVIYLVEGDPNLCEAAESIKTACFTTEILEGFDVQRTSGLGDTFKKYGYLTQAINQYYQSLDFGHKSPRVCPPYGAFIRKCEDLDKMTVSDVFAIQLMQVPQVTEEVAIAVVEMYPTLLSLARAYFLLDGEVRAQEEMLKKQSNNMISGAASRNIFQLIWGNRLPMN